MITVIVNFPAPKGASLHDMTEAYRATTGMFEGQPGLVRKYYLFDEEGGIGGGVYLWESREQAEAFFDTAWRDRLTRKYGVPPEIRYFASPVIIDNDLKTVSVEAAE